MLRQKVIYHLYVKNLIFKNVRECALKKAKVLKILLAKFKYNIAIYKLNVYKTSAKQPQLISG